MANKSHERKYRIGIDLGGTKLLGIVFDEDFKPRGQERIKTKAKSGKQTGIGQMVDLVRAAMEKAKIKPEQLSGIGVGCPGPLELDTGIVLEMPNLGWKNTPVRQELENAFGCPVVVLNDVDAGIYGEWCFGAAKNTRCAVGVFPGTGIGGGCVYNGDIILGKNGSCMEVGHIPVVENGPLCGCGQKGCLEAVASRLAISAAAAAAAYRGEAPHLRSVAGTDLSRIRSGLLAASIKAGDTAVERIVRDAARRIGWACAGIVNLLAPDVIVLGGGLVEALPSIFEQEVSKATRDRVMPTYRDSFRVVPAELGDNATAMGAAAWAKHTV
uniref:Glucokinase n=1 Tax=Candidatus Kentrum sp. FM TaxID=2126340 RepID=A0A450S6Z3_9GAMM|nr:MAG: glucokinase [Candidatus Kentron sp. FM]VFJ61875.1 MAG: glucokinase [Candidatus Kentron sp. FM]VFK18097.1 MAG: glucokinase [Candidatus Kentron sp. FM]